MKLLKKNNSKVSVVILSWNNIDKTLNAINSVLNTNYLNFEIILVDNGSENEVVRELKEKYLKNKKIKLIFNGKNLGSAEGRNVGFRNSSKDAKYVAFFDNDTIIPKEYIGRLVGVLDKYPKVYGVNGAFSKFEEYPSKNTTLTMVSFDAPYFDKNLKGRPLREAVALTGSGCMYDKKFISPIPFSKDYFFGGEEVYLGLLVYLKGGKCVKVLNAPYEHLSQNLFQITKTPLASYHATKNRLMTLFLFFERKTLFKIFPIVFISQLFYFFYSPKLMLSKLKAYFWLLTNLNKLIEKRKKLQKIRKVRDEYIIKSMSGKFQDSNVIKNKSLKNVLGFLNKLFLNYCGLVGIKTKEFFIDGKGKG
jgi:GT2 family glycosyltransferase